MKWNCFSVVCTLLLAAGLTGCASVKYQTDQPTESSKPPDYPIPVYTEGQSIPRKCEIIGTVSVKAGRFAMFGGSAEKETIKILNLAHEKGADAVKIMSLDEPDFANPNYRMKAQLLRYTDTWETVGFTEKEFQNYLATNPNRDPIEGIWATDEIPPETIGIVRDNSKPGRNFVGFILQSVNPVWLPQMKKMDIRRGPQSGSYVVDYYLDDFERREMTVVLGNQNSFLLTIWNADGDTGATIAFFKKY